MFQVLFWKKFPFCPFWPKTVQNWPFWPKMPKNGGFSHFFRNPFIIICSFFVLSLDFGVEKKWRFHIFWENSKMALFGQNWPKFGLNLAISGYIRPEAWVFKNIFVENFENFYYFFYYFFFKIDKKTISGEINPYFSLMNTIVTPLSPHLEKYLNS